MAQNIENNVRRLRQIAGLTIDDLAAHLGVDRTTVSRWENGSRPVPDEFKVRIARHFGWPVHAVFLFDTDMASVGIALRALTDRVAQLEVAS